VRVVSLNVAVPREITWRGRPLTTAIFKEPAAGRLALRGHNLAGDRQADLTVHGGADKVVYAYPVEHYPFWCEWLGVAALPWGAFGENLSTEGLREEEVGIGDRYRIGGTVLEVSQPRIPCQKLAARHGRADLPKHFLQSGRSGFYFRVIDEGEIGAGDAIDRVLQDPHDLRVADVQALARGAGDASLLA
jgi:MOSC domain-containing protein YiiM